MIAKHAEVSPEFESPVRHDTDEPKDNTRANDVNKLSQQDAVQTGLTDTTVTMFPTNTHEMVSKLNYLP